MLLPNVNSQIIEADISNNTEPYSYWHDSNSWNNNVVPGEGNDINIPENTIKAVITNKSNITDNTKFGKLNVPAI